MKLAAGIVLVCLLTSMRPAQAEPSKTFTDTEIMQIRNLLEKQKADLDDEKGTSLYWYNKYLKLKKCITENSALGIPVMPCVPGNIAD